MNYVPFNVKTDYSLLQSLIKINDLFSFCEKNSVRYVSICDNNLSAAAEFFPICSKLNIKGIIGLEIMFDDIVLSLYPKNYSGYKNLLKINTLREKNELSFGSLKTLSEDIICVTDYEYYLKVYESSVFSLIYIGYKNQFEKTNALVHSENVIFNRKIKVLEKTDSVHLNYLNELGGLNNLSESLFLEECSDEKMSEYIKFFSLINVEFPANSRHIPLFCENDYEFLKNLSYAGLNKRLNGVKNLNYYKRLDYELSVILKMGFVSYFLVVYDYVLYAKKSGIYVGPGRGSAAGSLVCYAVGITDIDPIEYDLLFERFLNPSRVSMPDIDIDFDSEKREQIIAYVRKKYGNEFVAVGSTYNTLKTKLVLREVGKIKKIDEDLFSKFLRIINRTVSLKENLKNEKVIKFLKMYPQINEVYKISLKLENLKKNMSTHAAGVVICDTVLDEIIPIYCDEENYKTGFSMEYLENLGILKMDFLGLKNLTTISNVLNESNADFKQMSLEDEKIIDLFKSGNTNGIFQYETYAMKNLLTKLKPNNFNEIIASVALVRPGPNDFLDEYISGRDNPKSVVYPLGLENILKETYGVILYQEQIIKILNVVGGFSNEEADLVRRAISKKKSLSEPKEKFINGATIFGYERFEAENLFRKIEKFAGYGFNKSHSVAYALIGYQMAYLKVYYESFFIKEILKGSKDAQFIEGYINEIKQKNIPALKPDVNYSKSDFSIVNNKLVLPLNLIHKISKDAESEIIKNAPYEDLFDFCLKNKSMKKDLIENLIYAGAMRSFKCNVKTLYNNLEAALVYAQLSGFGQKPMIEKRAEYSQSELSNYEFSMYGFYISNHPSSKYNSPKIMKLNSKNDNMFKDVLIIVKIEKITNIKTKKGDDMAFFSVSDDTGVSDVVVFSSEYEKIKNTNKGDFVQIYGKINKNQDKINIVLKNIMKMES